MRSPMNLALIAMAALCAALALILDPTLLRSFTADSEKQETVAATPAKPQRVSREKSARRKLANKSAEEIDRVFAEEDEAKPKAPRDPLIQMSPHAAGPVLPPGTISFEPVTLKTAEVFAKLKQPCRGRDCGRTFQAHQEKQRIHDRVLRDAAKACRNQQLDGCQIQARLLDYAGDVMGAKGAMLAGRKITQRAVTRCNHSPQNGCDDATARHTAVDAALKSLDKKMIDAH